MQLLLEKDSRIRGFKLHVVPAKAPRTLGPLIPRPLLYSQDSNKRELPSCPAFSPVGKEKIAAAISAEIDPGNLVVLNPLSLHLSDIDLRQIRHPLSCSFWC